MSGSLLACVALVLAVVVVMQQDLCRIRCLFGVRLLRVALLLLIGLVVPDRPIHLM
jgi:hypothetical protein